MRDVCKSNRGNEALPMMLEEYHKAFILKKKLGICNGCPLYAEIQGVPYCIDYEETKESDPNYKDWDLSGLEISNAKKVRKYRPKDIENPGRV